MRVVVVAVMGALLTGCAAMRAAQMEANAKEKAESCKQRQSDMTAKNKEAIAAFLAGKSIAEKLPLGGKKVSFEMLNNKEKPVPAESNDLMQYREIRAKILLDSTGWWMDCAPKEVSTAFLDASRQTLTVHQDLAMSRMTFGQAAERLDKIAQDYEANVPSLMQQARSREQQEWSQAEAAQAARDQAAAAAFAAGMASMPRPQPIYVPQPVQMQVPAYRAPTQTTCNRFGNQVNCTTY
ncbi:hypothetical protein ACNRBH_03200 [Ralstonia pseudosolanacearum]|uniref:hypothetical protein n=1 Tax=Ralstonia pseudosolanacearum TaxID=1310165 RepID=UPI0026773ECB|nr:hypothetical protein [Ralstonia pseudosolanacearum]MDO3526323.1 hypothetical protein [Ralstonia pseudosolanacearum]MDO3531403.1 hypothetical protein [Ralstonia pseudosolanacearum]MDO3538314.1 hypothetical protein [Ralstonia pseudosolanacearum]